MDNFIELKETLLKINQAILALFRDARSIPGLSDYSFEDWEKTCQSISQQINEEVIRVAVVGPIKSGKSTFINSLFDGDYLKRGAGVVTSMVTRIRSGSTLKAALFFKFWDEVNTDIEQTLVLFPSLNGHSDRERFEIRRAKERRALQEALDALSAEQLITNDTRNVNSVLLSSYLKGYEKVKDIISSDNLIKWYEEDLFAEHKTFVSDDSLSVYLEDIQLEIDSKNLDSHIEIADCQGSDSPNPLHLAKIQDYLLLTHLIIYVVSSRTGLRQADIKFLSMIKKMGIMDNILFVVNCDFSEHPSLGDLTNLLGRVREELSLLKPDPEIYAFSALFNLFKSQDGSLIEKDGLRLAQWEGEEDLAGFSDQETTRLKIELNQKITRERVSLLFKNHLERLYIISSGIDHWIHINQDILFRGTDSVKAITVKIQKNQERMVQLKSLIQNTLDGAIQKIKGDLKKDVDRFFDIRTGQIMEDTLEFIRNCKVSYGDYEENLRHSGFTHTLFLVFQEFKQAIDAFMAEAINPEVIRFLREKEKKIQEFLSTVANPYHLTIQEAISEFNLSIEDFGIKLNLEPYRNGIIPEDFDSIKGILGLKLPPSDTTMRYSARIKTEAILRLGFYSVIKLFKKILKKPVQNEKEGEMQALKDGVKRMKRETEHSVIAHFKDYKENIKFQYLFKLVEGVSHSLYNRLTERFQAYVTDLSKSIELIGNQQTDKQQTIEVLKEMEENSRNIEERIAMVRERIEATL